MEMTVGQREEAEEREEVVADVAGGSALAQASSAHQIARAFG